MAPTPQEAAARWMELMYAQKGQLGGRAATVGERYERLREQYAGGTLDLEDFTAGVVELLREGL